MSKVQTIIDQLKDLSLLEATELVSQIELTFDVSATPQMGAMMMAPAAGSDAPAADEKSEFNVKVTDVPADKKIAVIKVVKTALNIGLGDAKTMVEGAPFVLKEAAPKEEAEALKNQLVEAGATVVLE
jgi:large subunit ribosomal protein L7/L12